MRRTVAGYTLLEVLVAFVLLASALMLLIGVMATGSRQVRQSEDMTRARLHAQGLMTMLGLDHPLSPGTQRGAWEGGRYRWELQVMPWQSPASIDERPDDRARLWQVQLSVVWGEGPAQQLKLKTLRLSHPAPEPST